MTEQNAEKGRHVTSVETTEYPGGATYRAACHGCGWTGPLQAVKKHAHGDAGDHILDHFDPSIPSAPQTVEGVGTGAGGGDDPAQTEATLRVNRSVGCPEDPAQAHPLDHDDDGEHFPWHYTEFGVVCACGSPMRADETCIAASSLPPATPDAERPTEGEVG